MKTSAVLRIVIWFIVGLFLIGVLISGIKGDTTLGINIGLSGYNYENSEKYLVGDGVANAKDIENIDINWVSGKIIVEEYDGENIEFYEESTFDLKEDNKLRYLIENKSLTIQFKESRKFFGFSLGNTLNKTLVMKVPKSLNTGLNSLNIDTVSSNVEIEGISSEEILIEVVSGSVKINDIITDSLNVESVSGSTQISGEINVIDTEAVSGKISMDLSNCPDEINAETVSGTINIYIPENEGFTAEHSTVSGKFKCDFEVIATKGEAVYKNGNAEFDLETVSGGININKK